MIYNKMLEKVDKHVIKVAVIGAGHFGTAIVTQQNNEEWIDVVLVADINLESAQKAYTRANIPEEKHKYASTAEEAEKLIQEGYFVYTNDANIIANVPSIEVVCEGTGVPEASAKLSLDAINAGKHVVSISKEMDSVVGPILKRKAKEKGVVYSPVDGDQPSLLMALVEWARLIGLEVISGGKARDGEFILDEKNNKVYIKQDGITVHEDASVNIKPEDMKYLEMIPEGKAEEYIAKRAELLSSLPNAGAFDLCELTIVANCTGLKPASYPLTQATLRITELPVAYCEKQNKGIYEESGIIDVHTNFRRFDESGMGGGVYIVVKCDNAYSQYIVSTKGQIPNYDLSTAVIYRPYHLCGVETGTSILCAAFLGVDTGSMEYKPIYDLVKVAAVDIPAGETLGNDHDLRLIAEIRPQSKKSPSSPLPGHMITGSKVTRDIKKGEIITYDMVEDKSDSVLWKLRSEQENLDW
ncbi:MAG: flagellar biosynthesis protein FlgA [Christensenellaceae bacterium]|nr:flagellar biosynthesis protein FlgA [Christensenellaceae bacterium]